MKITTHKLGSRSYTFLHQPGSFISSSISQIISHTTWHMVTARPGGTWSLHAQGTVVRHVCCFNCQLLRNLFQSLDREYFTIILWTKMQIKRVLVFLRLRFMLLTWILGSSFQQFLNIPEKFINFEILRSIPNWEIKLLLWQFKVQKEFCKNLV